MNFVWGDNTWGEKKKNEHTTQWSEKRVQDETSQAWQLHSAKTTMPLQWQSHVAFEKGVVEVL